MQQNLRKPGTSVAPASRPNPFSMLRSSFAAIGDSAVWILFGEERADRICARGRIAVGGAILFGISGALVVRPACWILDSSAGNLDLIVAPCAAAAGLLFGLALARPSDDA